MNHWIPNCRLKIRMLRHSNIVISSQHSNDNCQFFSPSVPDSNRRSSARTSTWSPFLSCTTDWAWTRTLQDSPTMRFSKSTWGTAPTFSRPPKHPQKPRSISKSSFPGKQLALFRHDETTLLEGVLVQRSVGHEIDFQTIFGVVEICFWFWWAKTKKNKNIT